MLIISLILSALLLAFANAFVGRFRHPGAVYVGVGVAVLVAPFFLMCFLPAVTLQAFLLGGAAAVWRWSGRGPSFFLPLSIGATLAAYGVAGMLVLQSEREYARLRARYPYESMEARLPTPRPVPGGVALSRAASRRLIRLEGDIAGQLENYRAHQLRRLHEDAVELFINSPGFGVARMFYPSEASLALHLRPVPPQPGPRPASAASPGELATPADGDEDPLGRLLDGSIADFASPQGFGFFKDRRHVAGFVSHRFGEVPGPSGRWSVRSLELVGLLLHDEPRVYVSDRLPRMEPRGDAPTRPTDRFERFGLDALRQGDDLVVARDEGGLRMLGAVRSNRRCVDCHGGARGDLLGAFSYTLGPDVPETPGP